MENLPDRHGSGRNRFHLYRRNSRSIRRFDRRGRFNRRRRGFGLLDLAVIAFENEIAFKQKHSGASKDGQNRDEVEAFVCPFFFHAGQSVRFSLVFQLQTLSGNMPGFKNGV